MYISYFVLRSTSYCSIVAYYCSVVELRFGACLSVLSYLTVRSSVLTSTSPTTVCACACAYPCNSWRYASLATTVGAVRRENSKLTALYCCSVFSGQGLFAGSCGVCLHRNCHVHAQAHSLPLGTSICNQFTDSDPHSTRIHVLLSTSQPGYHDVLA